MISYKKVLPPEKWPTIEHFLKVLQKFADMANEHQRDLDVGVFMTEYILAYVSGPRTKPTDVRRRWRCKSQGICPACGRRKAAEGYVMCKQCQLIQRERARTFRSKKGGDSPV